MKKLLNRNMILLVGILLLSAFLRLYRIGEYMTFLGDEGRDLLAVSQILRGDLVFLGPRSSAADFYYGPIYFYLITPFLWLTRYDPVGPAIFIALLGIATVFLIYYIGKKMFSAEAGLFAAALYAVSPVVIAYSRSSWNPNPLPFVSLLTLYIAYIAIEKKTWKYFLGIGILLGIAIQLQYLALFLCAIVFLFIFFAHLMEKRMTDIPALSKRYIFIFLGFLIGWSPFLAFELKNAFPNLKTITNYILFGSGDKAYAPGTGFIENIQTVSFNLFGRLVTRFPPPEQVNVSENPELRLWQILTIVLGLLSAVVLFKVKSKLTILLFSLWLFLGCLFFGFYKREIYDYYLGFMFPLPFLLVGHFLSFNWKAKHAEAKRSRTAVFWKIVGVSLFGVLFVFNLYANPFRNTPNRQKDQVKMISEFVLAKTEGKPYNFALLTKGNSDHAYRYFFEIHNQPPVEIKNIEIDPDRKSITDQLLIVCEYTDCQPLGDPLWEVAGFGRAEIAGEWNVSVVKIYKLVHFADIKEK